MAINQPVNTNPIFQISQDPSKNFTSEPPWRFDLRSDSDSTPSFIANGNEIIFSLNVQNAGSDAEKFFLSADKHIGLLKNVHEVNFVYEATHANRDTSYYKPVSTSTKKGWNIIVGADGFKIIWEGDIYTCEHINLAGTKSNVGCSFENALEYCHRHGGEMFLPDEYYFNFFFAPMCGVGDENSRKANTANKFGAIHSQADYWLNIFRGEKEDPADPTGQPLYNLYSTAAVNFFDKLLTFSKSHTAPAYQDWTPYYSGWGADNKTVENSDNPFRNRYNFFFENDLKAGEMKDVNNHKFLTNGEDRNRTDMISHVNSMKANTATDLNLKYISNQLINGGFTSKSCMAITCSDESSDPVVYDADCHANNVRPMCIIKDIIQNEMLCPIIVGLNPDANSGNPVSIDHCGENVPKLLLSKVFGRSSLFDEITGEDQIHDWNLPDAEGKPTANNLIKNLKLAIEEMYVEKNIPLSERNLHDDNFLKLQPLSTVLYYENCFGTYNTATKTWHQNDETVRNICKLAKVRYLNEGPSGGNNNEIDLSGSGINLDFCECTDCTLMEFNDIQAVSRIGLDKPAATTVSGFREKEFCCNDGFVFEETDSYNYDKVPNKLGKCVYIRCEDENSKDSSAQTTPFWRQSRQTANTRKVWKHGSNGRVHADQNTIHGRCVQFTCPAPDLSVAFLVPNSEDLLPSQISTSYNGGDIVTNPCKSTHCGIVTRSCTLDRNSNSGVFSTPTGQCVPKKCRPPIVANAVTTPSLTSNGPFTITCNRGFVMLKNGQKLANKNFDTFDCLVDNNSCVGDGNSACCLFDVPTDVECKPVQCSNPCIEAGLSPKLNQIKNLYSVGETVDCECDCNLQASLASCRTTCTWNPTSLSASFTSTGCSCNPLPCPAATKIPHGKTYLMSQTPSTNPAAPSFSKASNAVYNHQDQIPVGNWVGYECDTGYELTWSHDDTLVPQGHHCVRQCYNPPSQSCGGKIPVDNYYKKDACNFAVMDPLSCYCKPKTCSKFETANLPSNSILKDSAVVERTTYYPDSIHYNYIDIECDKDSSYFAENTGYNGLDRVLCTTDTNTNTIAWSTSNANCITLACPNPRSDNSDVIEKLSRTLHMRHTCASLDEIKLPDGVQFTNVQSQAQAVFANTDSLPVSNSKLSFTLPNDGETKVHRATDNANVLQGSVYRFTCKKGFRAVSNNWESRSLKSSVAITNFECTCENGRWVCNKFCICEGEAGTCNA